MHARSQGGGVQGVLENPPFYEPPFLENTNPPPIAIIRVVITLLRRIIETIIIII